MAEFEFDFDLTPAEVSVRLGGVEYVLREATRAVAARFQNAQLRGARMEGLKVVGMPDDLAAGEAMLVGDCLFRCREDGKGVYQNAVGQQVVETWPARVVEPIFQWILKASGLLLEQNLEALVEQRAELDKKIEAAQERRAQAKNGPEPGTATSG